MTRRSLPVIAAGLSLLSLLSCSQRPVAVNLDPASVDSSTLIRMVRERTSLVKTLQGSGTVSFDSPEFGGTAAFELSMKKPDSLLVMLEGPFGIDIGSLFLGGEEYVAYNASENVVITGRSRTSTMRTIIPFDLTFRQVLDAFSGSFKVPDPDAAVQSYTVEGDQFLLRVLSESQICSYWIDNQTVQVTRVEIADEGGDVIVQASSSSFTEENDVVVPRRIAVWFPAEKKQITVVYSSLSINAANPSFAYSLPADAKVVNR